MPPKIQTRDSNISLTIITNSNNITISLTLIVVWFRAFISKTSTSLLLQSLMNQELSFWFFVYKTSTKIVQGFGYLFLFLSCVFVLWVFFFICLLCFCFPSSSLKFFLIHVQSLAVFLLINALICYGVSVTRNRLMLNRHTEGKKKKSINSASLFHHQNKLLFPIICSFPFSFQQSVSSFGN